MLLPANRRRLFALLRSGHVLLSWWGTPCITFTLALRWDGGPVPLRDPEAPHQPGPWLTDQSLIDKVEEGNCLADVTAEGIEITHEAGGYSIVENGVRSYIWEYPRLNAAFDRIDPAEVVTCYCAWPLTLGGDHAPWQKATRLKGTLPNLISLQRLCLNIRTCTFTGKLHIPLRGKAPDGRFWTRISEGYPAGLCAAVLDLAAAALDRARPRAA